MTQVISPCAFKSTAWKGKVKREQRDRITSFRKQGMKKEKPLIQHPTDPISTQTEMPVPQPLFDDRSMNLSEKEIVDLFEKMMEREPVSPSLPLCVRVRSWTRGLIKMHSGKSFHELGDGVLRHGGQRGSIEIQPEDMNLNEERKAPLRGKDLSTKREMVVQYISATAKSVSAPQNPGRPVLEREKQREERVGMNHMTRHYGIMSLT
ncbi:hypothetical protein H4Q32_020967 [Labeo rohita]|uniref:Uncharacterized protein n=1 Tax=Labeo rohita TaxID=84645 RepID=A0ABQ8M1Z7_LABRO|nr:hypothetical protein H4Q32_020967 [Labeo rohita]